jgi:hypothetical protein
MLFVPSLLLLLSANGSRFLRPFDLQLCEFDETGRGIQTLIDRAPGDTLMEIPNDCVVTSRKLFERYPILSEKLEGCDTMEHEEESSSSFYLSDEEVLVAGICLLKLDEDDYISSLPTSHASIITLPCNEWRNISTYLPNCYRTTLQATRNWSKRACSKIRSLFDRDEATRRSTSSLSEKDILWACSMVRSRSIAVPELKEEVITDGKRPPPRALFPGIDLLNHKAGAKTQLELTNKNVWKVTTPEKHTKGDQVFLSYGDDKDNWKLLLTYGFCLRNNPQHIIFFDLDDLIEAAMECPSLGAVITPRVKQSLMSHPQLSSLYTGISENRGTFSYDANIQAPRESLQNGLALLTSVARQLGSTEDSSVLATQLFQKLIERRRNELQIAVSKIPNNVIVDKPPWEGFVSSLELVLKQEFTVLTR